MSAELREALTAAGASALVPKVIDPNLFERIRRYSPLIEALPSQKIKTTDYYFNTRNGLASGGAVTDGGARQVSVGTYFQNKFTIKQLQVVGAVTGYAEEVTADVIGDLRAREIMGAIKGLRWDTEQQLVAGNAGATQFGPYPQFDGLASLINQYTATGSAGQNSIDAGGGNVSLSLLNQLIDLVESYTAAQVTTGGSDWMLVMSSTAEGALASLFTNQQRFMDVEVTPGLVVPSYRNIPIIRSSYLGTKGTSMGTVTGTPATTGGTLAAGTYYYKVAPVMSRQGEAAASAEVTVTTTGSTSTATLAFTPPTGFQSSTPQHYMVYRATATGQETLLGAVDATVGLAADGITPILTTSIVDTGTALVPQNGATVPAQTPATYVGTNTGLKPRSVGQEDIYLMSRDRDNVLRPYVRDLMPKDVYPTTSSPDSMPFAVVSDTCLAVRGAEWIGRLSRVTPAL
ncbi:phage major capsid protein [Streptomyces kaniharaensis]|uniref:Phage major capsid protein n=1 Tax=Streptomyces kaniharaensis TaxID=212423 RepID=A0A6N7KUL2_9ACTN|nr:phage major capsid protein [Streptomyces kaniharaensis]MQS14515.1 phage major capsid protein [Streptomyces kaniharaensis]